MNDRQPLDLWSRQLEGQTLAAAEAGQLANALAESHELTTLIEHDSKMHELLKLHFRLAHSSTSFVSRCVAAAGDCVPATTKNSPILPSIVPQQMKVAAATKSLRLRRNRDWAIGVTVASITLLLGVSLWLFVANNPTASQSAERPKNSASASPASGAPIVGVASATEMPTTTSNPGPTANSSNTTSTADAGVITDEPTEIAVDESDMDHNPIRGEAEQAGLLGTVRVSEDSNWETPPAEFVSFPATYKLREGLAELAVEHGPTVLMRGPATIRIDSPREIHVDSGQCRLEMEAEVGQVAIATPNVRLASSGDSSLFLETVVDIGTTVRVEKGHFEAIPWSNPDAERLELTAGSGLDRGFFGMPWNSDSKQPAAAYAVNESGQFKGILDVADRPLTITSPKVLAQVLETSKQEIEREPNKFPEKWQGMVDNLNQAASGAISINGETRTLNSPEEMLEFMQQFQERVAQMGNGKSTDSPTTNFSGVMNINGAEQRFNSPEEFSKAQEKAFGSFFAKMFNNPLTMPNEPDESASKDRPFSRESPFGNQGFSASAFSGMININGREMKFSQPEEFNRAMQQFAPQRLNRQFPRK